jgi:hypothetical protein
MSNLVPKSWNPTAARCLSGFRANERPTSFLLDDREIEVRSILESWRDPVTFVSERRLKTGGCMTSGITSMKIPGR